MLNTNKKKSILAIIPARGGSKRIPYKNIKKFSHLPIIAWSIKVAKNSKLFDEIMVSTEDDKIAKVSKKFGAKIPFKRSKKIKDPEAKSESRRYENPVASRTLILKTISKNGMMTQSSVRDPSTSISRQLDSLG